MTPPPVTLRRLALREIRLPLREPFRISSGTVTERRILLVEATDADGAVAWAECVAGEQPNYGPETVDTAWWAIREWLAPRLLGRTLPHPGAARALVDAEVRGHAMAKAAVEMACWGLAAELARTSLSQLLGGTRDVVPVGISLGIQATPEALVERVLRARDAGYRRIKMKIAPGLDVQFVAAARAAVGGDVTLSVDANSAYTPRDAGHLAQLDAYGLAMIEQPLARDDLRRHAELQRRIATPICLDESITDADRAEDMIALGAGRIVNIKPGRVGGFAESKAIHDTCLAAGIPVWCGGMLESGIGRAYNVALASLPGFTLPGDLSPSARYWERDVVTPEWTMSRDGEVTVPRARRGIGVEVDLARVDGLTVRAEVLGS